MTKTALVTGSAGFVGRHMTRELEARGYDVYGVDLPRDANQVFRSSLKRHDLVVHCAFHVGGRAAIDGVNTNFLKNLQLDSAMFEWAIRTKQKRVLYFSSSAAYPVSMQSCVGKCRDQNCCPDIGFRLNENDIDLSGPEMPDSNYGWAKLTGERMAEDARRNALAVSVVRPFSGYGEDQSLVYPFPSIVQRASRGDLSVWGSQGQTRDWIHVSDVVRGALAVVDSETTDPVNLCTGIGTEMGELAEMIWHQASDIACPPEYLHNMHRKVEYLTDKPTGVFYRVGDPSRFNQYYTPTISVEEGIRRALALKAS